MLFRSLSQFQVLSAVPVSSRNRTSSGGASEGSDALRSCRSAHMRSSPDLDGRFSSTTVGNVLGVRSLEQRSEKRYVHRWRRSRSHPHHPADLPARVEQLASHWLRVRRVWSDPAAEGQDVRGEAAGLGVEAVLSHGSRLDADRKRSEERRVGKECWITCRSRWSPYH